MITITKYTNDDLDVQETTRVQIENVERDSEEFVTLYGTDEKGTTVQIVLDQKTIDQI